MQNKLALGLLSLISITTAAPAFSLEENSCYIEVAVSSPPVDTKERVAFNVTNNLGFSKSVTLIGGSAPQVLDKLLCTDASYAVSATLFSSPRQELAASVGQCKLKTGEVTLKFPNNSVSVVFPNDFDCF